MRNTTAGALRHKEERSSLVIEDHMPSLSVLDLLLLLVLHCMSLVTLVLGAFSVSRSVPVI